MSSPVSKFVPDTSPHLHPFSLAEQQADLASETALTGVWEKAGDAQRTTHREELLFASDLVSKKKKKGEESSEKQAAAGH